MDAWCTKLGRGTRVIPAGALQGAQYMKTPDYAQVVGFIDQQWIDINRLIHRWRHMEPIWCVKLLFNAKPLRLIPP
jgi:hypothetical protein